MQLSVSDDDALLAQGMALFESLYRAFEQSARSPMRSRICGVLQLRHLPYAIAAAVRARSRAGPSLTGFMMGASTLTGIFVKLPAGAWSDILGRRPLLIVGALDFATLPFTYLGVFGTIYDVGDALGSIAAGLLVATVGDGRGVFARLSKPGRDGSAAQI